MNLRLPAAIASSQITYYSTKLLRRGGGTAAPGLVAEKIDPQILSELTSNLPMGSVIISGTNGKTTSTRLLSHIFKVSGIRTIHNRAGSNLTRGVASTLIEHSNLLGQVKADLGLFEVDEGALPLAAKLIKPKVLVLTNLFRDQLDRYFELDRLLMSWRQLIKDLPADSTLVLNADDPRVTTLGHYAKGKVIYYGIHSSHHQIEHLPQAADVLSCPNCQNQLSYEELYLGHQGKYFCSNCQFKRPPLDVSASKINLEGLEGVTFDLSLPNESFRSRLGVPGFYNVYNALAAAAAAVAFQEPSSSIQTGLGEFRSVFGRIERIPVGSKEVLITLVKNPTGFNEVLRLLAGTENEHLLLALNDLYADGRDVSWIWDVDLEKLTNQRAPMTISGIRAWDLANRLKYAGVETKQLTVEPDLAKAFTNALNKTPKGKTLFVLPTYTAMLELRQILTKKGHVKHFWED